MKAKIIIEGGISSNFAISNKLGRKVETNQYLTSLTLHYNTVKEAKEDLKRAWKALKEEGIDIYTDSFDKKGESFSYDASKASIVKNGESEELITQ